MQVLRYIFSVIWLIIIAPVLSHAHVDHGGMPDSVAEMEYKILLEFEPDNYDVRAKLGDILIRLKKYQEAHAEYITVLQQKPDYVPALIGLGQLLLKERKLLDAEKKFCELQGKYPQHPLINYYLGLTYKELGKLTKAKATLTNALATAQKSQDEEDAHTASLIEEALTEIKNHTEASSKTPPK